MTRTINTAAVIRMVFLWLSMLLNLLGSLDGRRSVDSREARQFRECPLD
jgi:hypothetical protein